MEPHGVRRLAGPEKRRCADVASAGESGAPNVQFGLTTDAARPMIQWRSTALESAQKSADWDRFWRDCHATRRHVAIQDIGNDRCFRVRRKVADQVHGVRT
jgi:hypothetical protein